MATSQHARDSKYHSASRTGQPPNWWPPPFEATYFLGLIDLGDWPAVRKSFLPEAVCDILRRALCNIALQDGKFNTRHSLRPKLGFVHVCVCAFINMTDGACGETTERQNVLLSTTDATTQSHRFLDDDAHSMSMTEKTS